MCLWPKLWEKISGSRYEFHHPCYTKIAPETPKDSWWTSFWGAWISVWVIIPFIIFQCMHSYAMENRKEMLASMCDARSRMLQDQFNVSMNHVQAMSILISTFHHAMNPSVIDQKTFARYTERTAFERPLTSGVAYAVRVLASEREQFEKQQGWKIKKMDAVEEKPVQKDEYCTEALESSPPQEEYAPVIFAQDTVSHVVSVDMLSGKEDRENVLRARQSARGVLTAPFRLLKTNRLGVILTFAVYKTDLPHNTTPEERIQATYGYLGGIFDIESLVEKLLQQLGSKEEILVNVYDITNKSLPISMYGSNESTNELECVSPLNFGDPYRKHEMRCRFQEKPPMPWLALSIAISVHVIGLLAGHIINSTRNRIAKVEDDYNEMMGLKKRAEAADVAKSRFLATVSHEIRTPMNGVLGMLHMLMDTELDVTQQEYVRTAQASGKALVSIINEVLDQAKIESGKLELETVRFDLRSILDDVVLLFAEKSRDKGIELAVFISENVPERLVGDPGRFRQIITNLMGNSIKFTERGHIFVTVHLVEELTNFENHLELSNSLSGLSVAERCRSWANFTDNASVSDDSLRIVVSVEDTGCGIPFEAQARVFTPFMQVGPSISRTHGGTGIGLSISKYLVELMNGEIGFVSEPEVGSTFTFSAVFSKADETPNEKVSSEFEGMVGYVIDPRPVRAKVSKYHIQRLGIKVHVFDDLNQCFSKVNKETSHIHMVFIEHEVWLLDLSMSSHFVLKLSKVTGIKPNLFVLASSKMGSTEPSFLALNVITKPLKAGLLAASLRRAMGMKNKDSLSNKEIPNSSLQNYLLNRKILIVDDNEVNLKVAAGALRKYGADVVHAKSGEEAIKFLKPPHSFDACFMDIQMPEMDGFEATRRIREMEKESADGGKGRVPILAMTADVFNATHDECLKYGMDGYVSKPFEAEQLYQEVSRLFPIKT